MFAYHGFFYCVVTSSMVSMVSINRSFIIVENMLRKLLLNSCSFNEVQPKDKLFSKGLFLRVWRACGKWKCALQAKLSRSRDIRYLMKDICRMGVVRQSNDPENL